jgi:hypothetical protein
MTCINFTVYEAREGWFVNGMHPIGPFFSRLQAVDLAEGMVAAVRAMGEDATMVIEESRTWAAPEFHALRSRATGRVASDSATVSSASAPRNPVD